EAGLLSLADGATGELPLGVRRRIYALLGPELRDADDRPTGVGHQRRVLLDALVAQRTLPVWEPILETDDRSACCSSRTGSCAERSIPRPPSGRRATFWSTWATNL